MKTMLGMSTDLQLFRSPLVVARTLQLKLVDRMASTASLLALSTVIMACPAVGQTPGSSPAPTQADDLPSYITQSPLTIAALVQGEQKAAISDATPTSFAIPDLATEPPVEPEPAGERQEKPVQRQAGTDLASEADSRSIFVDRKTQFVDGQFALPPIAALTTDQEQIGNGTTPEGFRDGQDPPQIALPESGAQRDEAWQWYSHHWVASNTFSHPLYFQDRMLERHGHQCHPCLQPVYSGGRFLAQTVMLPYLGAISPPSTCEYSLGYYRTGNCAPALKQRPPYQRKAAAAQATAVALGIAILP